MADTGSLIKSLERYFSTEERIGDNGLKIDGSNTLQDVSQELKIKKLPPILWIQLSRVIYDNSTGRTKKLNNYFEFPRIS